MNRLIVASATAVLLVALGSASVAVAQDQNGAAAPPAETAAPAAAPTGPAQYDANWPAFPLQGDEPIRGPGWYVSLWKMGLVFCFFLIWIRTTDWVSRDCSALGLNYNIWNSLVFFPFVVAFLLFLLIPIFWLGFPLLLIAQFVPLGVYIQKRNSLVHEAEKVLTKDHLRYLVANMGKLFGAKIDTQKKMAYEKGPPVEFQALGGESDAKNQANLIEARQSPAYITLKEIFADAVTKRAERVLLDFTADSVSMKYQIDGVWHDLPARQREAMDPVAAVAKKLANLDVTDRRSKQEGALGASFDSQKFMGTVATQGTATGERVLLTIAGKGQPFKTLEDLGMRDKMRDQLKELLASPHGIFLFSSLPTGGLSTTMAAALKSTDRLLRDFVAIGDKARHEPEVENVEVVTYDPAAGETVAEKLPKIILRQPDALVIRELTEAATLRILCEQCTTDHPKISLTSIRAKDAPEALLRVAALKVPAKEFAPWMIGVLNVRLIRKLCDKCKEAYEPTPELLARLGIPAGRIQQLYRERQPLPPDSKEKRLPCEQCNEIGYFGRTGIFELLVVNDKIREALIKEPKLETIKRVAKATGQRSLQDEGIALVALGITSLSELQRVLKQ
jgi:type II secretory ATPase GspE/PulE/Tfp pilus assembly ATPase PilB-like protein